MKTNFSTKMLAFVLVVALVVPMLVFNVSAEDRIISFALGANGSAGHADGSSKQTYTETVDGYTLNITGGTNMYTGARDATGNGCIKLGTSSKAGKFTFTVPDDVASVVLHVAKYKANNATVKTNGTSYVLTKASTDGQYDAITVDTSSTKTVSFEVSSGYRAMVNGIDFILPASGEPSISITSEGNVLQIGQSMAFSATLTNLEGDVVWASGNEDVATVDATGNVTGVALGKATITASVGEVTQTKEITVYPVENSVITVEEALEIATAAGESATPYTYQIIGVVESIDTAYSEQYGNITVTIGDDTGSIYVYRMNGGETLQMGQKIAVCGNLQTYSGKPQVSQYSVYELVLDDSVQATVDALEALELKMSLVYKYETAMENVEVSEVITDTLNNAFTGVTGTSYAAWSGKTGASGAVYAGQSAGGNTSIQLRSNNSNSGVITTASAGRVKSITVTWNTGTSAGRTLDIYAKNTAYENATDLYNSEKAGDKVASLKYDGTTATLTYEFSGDYTFIAFRSNSGAQYLASVSIEWENESDGGETVEKEICSNSEFAFRFGVDEALASIAGIDGNGYGLRVSAGGNSVDYATTASSWKQENGNCYVTVTLGDIIQDKAKLSTEFTVQAYVVVDDIQYVSENAKTFSVADMIKVYYETEKIAEVEHLYNYLNSIGLI